MWLTMRVLRKSRFGGTVMRWLWQITAIVLSVLMPVEWSVPASAATPPEPLARLSGHMLPVLKDAKPVASIPGADTEPLTLTVVLNRADQAGFDRYLQDVYNPHSSNFRHFLKLPEMTA